MSNIRHIVAAAIAFAALSLGATEPRVPRTPFATHAGFTGSMKPTFRGGELIVVRPIDYKDLRPGMIVVVRARWSPTGLILHRVHRVTPHWFSTRGDANRFFDPLNAPESLVGVVDDPRAPKTRYALN